MKKQNIFLPSIMTLFLIFMSSQSLAADRMTVQKVTDDVYAIVGPLTNRTTENLANNATFGFVVTSEGVVLIDSGGTYQGAAELEGLIKTITDKPVVTVINTGGQDHRWLGNDYFKKKGAQIIASEDAVKDQTARTQDQFFMLGTLMGDDALKDTNPVYAETTFDKELKFKKGGMAFEIYHTGQAHTLGDSFVWLPKEKVVFTGDIVFVERMLGIGPISSSKSWIKVYESIAAYKPQYIVPGHGQVTNLATTDKDTYGYLKFIRKSISDFMDNDGEITEVGSVDQSSFKYLKNYDSMSGRNALQVYSEIEFE